jgi:TonB family protein
MLEQLEQQETQEQLVVPRLEVAPPAPVFVENDQRQRRRMVIALVMLLVALGLVLIKDRDFWFPASDVTDSELVDEADQGAPTEAAATDSALPGTPAPSQPVAKRKATHSAPRVMAQAAPPETPAAPAVSATRAVLPPLRVEVVAGDQRQLVHPGSTPSVKVELQNGAPGKIATEPARASADVPDPRAVTGTGERVEMSTDTRQALTRPVRPEYPLLARQMKVQGQVILSVFIDKDGSIENLQIVSGPAILADAARAAVKQWRFKPYYQDGVAVATQARVTVAFTIGVAN